jgi:hypothetical protein
MLLDRFKAAFTTTAEHTPQSPQTSIEFDIDNLGTVLDELGGNTFNQGLYRVLRAEQVPDAQRAMEAVFPEYRGRIVPFGFDWLGRHFACDRARLANGQPQVLLLEVGAGAAMQVPANVLDFHNVELVECPDDALAVPFWMEWRSQGQPDLAFTQCVGYKVPLFFGGADVLNNLEVVDTDVYVHICGQLRNEAIKLAPGQTVRSVRFTSEPGDPG